MKAKFRFSNELLSEFEGEATRRITANIEKYNRGHQPPIEPDYDFDPDHWLAWAMAGCREPAPSQWGVIPGCRRLESKRLYIHILQIIPNEDDGCCSLYIATLKDFSITPRVIVSMIATQDRGLIHWLETAVRYRRKGYALEFLRAIEDYCGDFIGEAATEDGEGFLLAYDGAAQSKHGADDKSGRRQADRSGERDQR
jgi:GNAT superfamily N-acetyltransferase